MKKVFIFLFLFVLPVVVIASESYSQRFIKSFSACEPVTETTNIRDGSGNLIPITKMVQGVVNHKCMYKQVIIRPSVRDITTCEFTKPMLEEIAKSMKDDNGELYNVNLTIKGENIPMRGLTKSQVIWIQYLNEDRVCKREIIPR